MKKIVDFIIHNGADILARFTTKSPTLFKNLQKVFGILATVAGAALFLIDHGVWNPSFAPLVVEYGGYLIAIATTVFGVSALPVKDVAAKEEKKEAIKAAVVGDRPPPRQRNIDEQ
jgi:hypothetical protein